MFIRHRQGSSACDRKREGTASSRADELSKKKPSGAEVQMSKPPSDRTSFGSDTYFVTASTWGRRSLFRTERMARLFIDTLYHYRGEHKFLIHEFVVMPDHFSFIASALRNYARTSNAAHQRGIFVSREEELGLNIEIWGRGYIDHRIRDANDYARHVEYTRLNPVRARIAVTMEQYPYSSAQSGIRI